MGQGGQYLFALESTREMFQVVGLVNEENRVWKLVLAVAASLRGAFPLASLENS